jgi:hypothetical protein
MRTALKPLFVTALALLVSCAPEAKALSSEASSAAYEGESTFRVYDVTMDRATEKPLSLKFDMEFTAKNGEPICDKERRHELCFELHPDLSNLIGDGYGFVHFFFYDMECTQFVELDDIATCDLNLFYYVTG